MKSIVLYQRKVIKYLALGLALLLVLHLGLQYYTYETGGLLLGIVSLFNVGEELSVPTWFVQFLWLFAAVLSLFIAYQATPKEKKSWVFIGLLGLYFSIDEGAMVHERIITNINKYFFPDPLMGINQAWSVFALALMLPIGIYLMKFLIKLDPVVRNRIILAASVYVFGAFVVELVGSWYAHRIDMVDTFLNRGIFGALEEGCEMLGVILLINALLTHTVREKQRETAINFRP